MSQYFRAGVGIVVVNDSDRILALERYDAPGTWQLPQGGIEDGEDPVHAARRELWEETRLRWNQVDLLAEHPRWLAYELPRESWTAKTGRGQVQRWFVVALADATAYIDINRVDPDKGNPEFADFRWTSFAELFGLAVPFRRPLYEQVERFVATLNRRRQVDPPGVPDG